MIRRSLIPDSRRWYHRMPNDHRSVQHTCTSTGDKLFAAQSNHFFKQPSCQRSANPRMKDSQPFSGHLKLIDWVCPDFASQVPDDTSLMQLRELRNHILKETRHRMFRYVNRLDQALRFKNSFRCSIKLKYGIVLF